MHFCSSVHFKVVSVKVKQAIIRLLWGGERRLQSSLYPLLSPSETASHTKSDITSTGASHSLVLFRLVGLSFYFLYLGLAGQSKTRMYYHVSFFRHFNIGTETQIFRLYRERCCNSLKGWDFLKKNPSPITLVFIWTSSTCIPALMGRFCLRAQYKWRQALVTSLFVQHEKGWFLVKKKQCTSINISTQMHHVKCARLCLIGAFFFFLFLFLNLQFLAVSFL